MSRLVRRPIEVLRTLPEYDDAPAEFIDQGERKRVSAIIDHWREAGAWWDGEVGDRRVFRVLTTDSSMYDIERSVDDTWTIYRIWD